MDELLDLVVVAQLAGAALTERARERLGGRGHPGLRTSHGYLFQHLVEGPITIGELAMRMDVTQQAASKAVAELADLGYVERIADPADGRVRRVGLTARGRSAVRDTRAIRAELVAELSASIGTDRVEEARRTLLAALDAVGGMPAVRSRRVLPTS